jgi:hypothetical protein
MGKAGTQFTAIGAFMVAAFIGVGSSVWPEYIHPHPHFVVAFGVIGLVMLLFPTIYKLSMVASPNGSAQPAFNAVAEPIQDMQIELIEHGEWSSELILECINRGSPASLSASIKIDSASAGVAFKRLTYEGRWATTPTFQQLRSGVQYSSKPSVYVPEGKSARLRIATMEAPQKPEGNAYMQLEGTEEWATWDLEHATHADLPFFILSLEIRAKGKPQVLRKKYKVGPKSKNESLRMVEVSA